MAEKAYGACTAWCHAWKRRYRKRLRWNSRCIQYSHVSIITIPSTKWAAHVCHGGNGRPCTDPSTKASSAQLSVSMVACCARTVSATDRRETSCFARSR